MSEEAPPVRRRQGILGNSDTMRLRDGAGREAEQKAVQAGSEAAVLVAQGNNVTVLYEYKYLASVKTGYK